MSAGEMQLRFGSCDVAQNGAEYKLTGTNTAGAQVLHTAVNSSGYTDVLTIEAKVVGAPGHDPSITLLLPETGGTYVEMKINLLENGGPRVILDTWSVRGGLIVKAYTSDASNVVVKVDVQRYQEQ